MPFGTAGAHEVPVGFIYIKGGVEGEVQVQEFLHHLIPMFRIGWGSLFPESSGLFEAVLLVGVVVVGRVILNGAVVEQGLGESVPVFHGGEAGAGGVEHVPAGYVHLGVVAARAQPEFFILLEGGSHDIRGGTKEFDPVGSALLVVAHPFAGLFGSGDGLFAAHSKSRIG